ncbi:integrin alpha-5-like [Tigriopus californicus]|uniref:integrin alpha-5-like n=1 Tax=Tigriopus californicus TaxID=6832 RepID=UPI0027D9D878|nr:integrin alpha-5-like [Tigriopus californicus]
MTTSRQGELFTCAPRQGSDRYLNPYNSLGTCYRFTEDRNNSLREYFRFDRKLLEFSDYGLLTIMGHELTMSEDDSLVIGAPMARTRDFNWKLERTVGSIVRASPFFIPRAKESPWSRVTLSNLGDPHTYDLAGSAIVRGRYYYDFGPNHYAVGAPKAIMMRGAVFVCPDCLSPQNTRSDKVRFDKQGFSLEGFQLGSRFGQTLCTLDLNGDGFDDLVVGAPLFTTKREQGEAGNVYVYKTNVRGHVTTMDLMNQDLPRKVESGARFGATLASLGNLDGDGLEDFAVGAPYENDGAGAIYVYRGSRSFVFSDISQKLTPADFPRLNMANFGFSANANQDVDGNGSPDLIIGSRGSRHTVLLRSLKVERIAPRSSFVAPTKVNPKDNFFMIRVIATVNQVPTSIWRAQIWLNFADDRIEVLKNNATIELNRVQQAEASFRVQSLQKDFGLDDHSTPRPIFFKCFVNWDLDPSAPKGFHVPIKDPLNDLLETMSFEVPLQTGCEDNVCKCSVELSKPNDINRVVAGTGKGLEVTMTIVNHGSEPSYENKLEITSAYPIPFPNHLRCENSTTGIRPRASYTHLCNSPRTVAQSERTLSLVFEIQDWTLFIETNDIMVKMKLNHRCNATSQNLQNKLQQTLRFPIEFKSEIITKSLSSNIQTQYNYNSTMTLEFKHVYLLTNIGPSPTNKPFTFDIYVPDNEALDINVLESNFKCLPMTSGLVAGIHPPYTADTKALSCQVETCKVYQCTIPAGMAKDQVESVNLNMAFEAEKAGAFLEGVYKFVVHTAVREQSHNNYEDFVPFTTEFYSLEVMSLTAMIKSNWPHIIGVVVGLILLSVTFMLLCKFKFFSKTRYFKMELEAVENSTRHKKIHESE